MHFIGVPLCILALTALRFEQNRNIRREIHEQSRSVFPVFSSEVNFNARLSFQSEVSDLMFSPVPLEQRVPGDLERLGFHEVR